MNKNKLTKLFAFVLFFTVGFTICKASEYTISHSPSESTFPIVSDFKAASILISDSDFEGIDYIASLFCKDIEEVTGVRPNLYRNEASLKETTLIIIGTLGKSEIITQLEAAGKLDASSIKGKWEASLIQTIENPLKGIDRALVIVGSDKRGTIYGMFDISESIGVSPWHYWADVPSKKQNELYFSKGKYILSSPKVKYRGIFLNDEAPALQGWANEKFGFFNHEFYGHVFELILRLKGNFLWPGMWGKAFYDDDSLNGPLAQKYGIVMGTSHHEPLGRAHAEWSRYGEGEWNYEKNKEVLQHFWKGGMERMKDFESIVTIGMRGDGDEAMSEGTATELLEKIVNDQRKIIEQVTGKDATETPQVWALYKEVQDYYDHGMRVPDDVTLLLCDDNWSNIRVLPKPEDLGREGGFGMYYHFDFVGGPVSYRWLNTIQIEKVWEQMNLTYQYGVDRIWLVNVGDLKPMELPISFFLEMAWDPDAIKADDLPNYYTLWATQQFGPENAEEIGQILSLYTKYNARRKPEMLKPETYSLINYREAETVVKEYASIAQRAKKLFENIPADQKDAYYQLVLFPVEICANLNEMYIAAGKNRLYAKQNRLSSNMYAEETQKLFEKDSILTEYFHTELANGKWNHMMSQTHIGYTSWNNPPINIMPEVKRIDSLNVESMGIAVEGSELAYPLSNELTLPVFDQFNKQTHYMELFKKGLKPFDYKISTTNKWILLSSAEGTVDDDVRILVSIDWAKIPKGEMHGTITVVGAKDSIQIEVPLYKTELEMKGFIENNGTVAIESPYYSNKQETNNIKWLTIPNLGRMGSSVQAHPVNHSKFALTEKSPYLDYEFSLLSEGEAEITFLFSPTQNFLKEEGLHFGVSIDGNEPKLINSNAGEEEPDWKYPAWFNEAVSNHVKKITYKTSHLSQGTHTLRYYLVDPGLALQKIEITIGEKKESYLGAPLSKKVN